MGCTLTKTAILAVKNYNWGLVFYCESVVFDRTFFVYGC